MKLILESMAIDLNPHIRLIDLEGPLLAKRQIRFGVLRLDQIHPLISGNKWFKLKENIAAAKESNKTTLLTFGGAYSNHLIATAAAAQELGLQAIGLVRGLHAKENPGPTLQECNRLGMQLDFVAKSDYKLKDEPGFIAAIQNKYPHAHIIPEGGNNEKGREGLKAIADYLPEHADIIALPVGSGATLSGLRNALPDHVHCIGFAPFKNGSYLKGGIESSLKSSKTNWTFMDTYHFGGFAKHDPELIHFINSFYAQFQIPLDFVYTGKMMFGLMDMIKRNLIPYGSHLIAIHTGGLQGNISIQHLLDF